MQSSGKDVSAVRPQEKSSPNLGSDVIGFEPKTASVRDNENKSDDSGTFFTFM